MILPIVCLLFTLGVYWNVKRFYRRYPKVYFSPLLVTPLIVITALVVSGIPYPTYNVGTHWISDMIGPGTIAMAVPIYKNLHVLKKHAFVIVSSVLVGSTIAIVSSAGLAKAFHLSRQMIESIAPRSATTAIAMEASRYAGGIPTITAVMVMLTGLMGMVAGPVIIRLFRIRSDVARGVLFGTSAHNAGTSKAFEFSAVAGSIASIAMILTAFFTLGMVSWVIRFIL
jgi:predicted murein hydrolase (TIGR00659 family)